MKSLLIVFLLGLSAGRLSDVAIIVQAQAHGTSSEETPRGTIDGVNTTFTLNFQPAPWASIHVYLNGLRLHRGLDYTLGGTNMEQLLFNANAVPQPGDLMLADYTY